MSKKDSPNKNSPPPPPLAPVKYYYAVRSCSALEKPAIFYDENDRDALTAKDAGIAIQKTFDSLEEAHKWITTTKVPQAKSRKRKAALMINPVPNQRQELNNQKWEEKFNELIKFSAELGDGDPNLALSKEYHRPDLAAFLGHQRQDYSGYLAGKIPPGSLVDRKTRFLRLLEIGVRLNQEKTYKWPTQAQKWREFVSEHPMTPLTLDSDIPLVVELAKWQEKQVQEYIKMLRKETPHEMPPHRLQKLREWGFPFPKNVSVPKKVLKTFDERVQEFVEWKTAHGSALVPQSTRGLGEWVKEQRKEYRKFLKGERAYISQERVDKLTAAGFVFEVRKRPSTGGGGGEESVNEDAPAASVDGEEAPTGEVAAMADAEDATEDVEATEEV